MGLSAYPQEEEFLLQDGIEYRVERIGQSVESLEKEGRLISKKTTLVILSMLPEKYSQMNCCMRSIKLIAN